MATKKTTKKTKTEAAAAEENKPKLNLPENHCLKGIAPPKTDAEIEEDIKKFGPWTQVAYKVAVFTAMFEFPWEVSVEKAIGLGLDSDDEFFQQVNSYYHLMDLGSKHNK